jgi:hypothetical protein
VKVSRSSVSNLEYLSCRGQPQWSHGQVHLLGGILGRRVPGGRTKDGVMNFASPDARPKFSKYVGVQEWRNAVFLMFNVVSGNTYGNSFIDKVVILPETPSPQLSTLNLTAQALRHLLHRQGAAALVLIYIVYWN